MPRLGVRRGVARRLGWHCHREVQVLDERPDRHSYSTANGGSVLPINGSGPSRLLVAARSPGGLSFSPDDSQLVYAALRRGPGAAAQSDLFVIPVQGGAPRALAPSPYDDTAPAWQPVPAI